MGGISAAVYLWGPHLYDVYAASRYTPSSQVAAIDQRLSLTNDGKTLLFASNPAVEEGTQFNEDCKSVERSTAMLGCYYKHRIFVFNVQNPELDGATEVTTAHELLHAAYDRLNVFEKQRVNALIQQEYETIKNDPDIKSLMSYYNQAEPGAELNELHSIIGTTIETLPPELEAYYGKYFGDRRAIVALNARYTAVFKDVQERADALAAELKQEGAKLKTDLAQYDADRAQLETDIATFNTQVNSGALTSRSAYEAARATLVARVSRLNAQRDDINTRVADYNDKVQQLNALSVRVDELNKSINGIATPSTGL